MSGLRTSHYPVSFYIGMFNRCYRNSDAGWSWHHTPDDRPFLEQDNFTWSAMEAIARKLNQMIALERAKHTPAGGK